MPEPKPHYIAMAGLRGYLPQYCEVFPDKDGAIDSLVDLHELYDSARAFEDDLRKNCYTDLDLTIHGNEYAEVQPCTCDSPQDHSEDDIDLEDFE
jgi:hypothetical protein